MSEQWLLTPLHDRYEVSDQGGVRRLWKSHSNPLQPYLGRHGYPKVQLGSKGPRIYVHTLIALTFFGPRPVGHHVDHLDFDRLNNALSNLRYLPAAVNSVRWANRVKGQNVWELIKDLPEPEDFVHLSKEESNALCQDFTAQGW